MPRTRVVCCTLRTDSGGCVSGWGHSVTYGQGVLTLNISRPGANGQTVYHPKWNGKKWRYRTFEQLQTIQDFTDKIGLACGSLVYFDETPYGKKSKS